MASQNLRAAFKVVLRLYLYYRSKDFENFPQSELQLYESIKKLTTLIIQVQLIFGGSCNINMLHALTLDCQTLDNPLLRL